MTEPSEGSRSSISASSLVIAVLTFRRPADIAAALPLLVAQAASVTGFNLDIEILVVDNDADGSARSTVEGFLGTSPVPVRYVVEPTPGISAARNRALSESADRDLLVFIDDDERPTSAWLHCLLDTYASHGGAAVVGPVVSEFESPPEPWIEAGRFFVRRRLPTGTPVDVAATNNLLLDLRQVRAQGLTFDPAFGIGGGEDQLFTRSLHRRGAVMTWCDEAVVLDVVPNARLSRRWVTHRAFSSGNSWSLTSLALAEPRERTRIRLVSSARGLVRFGGGCARFVIGVLTGSMGWRARGVRTAARGAGMLAGAVGYSYQEYRRTS